MRWIFVLVEVKFYLVNWNCRCRWCGHADGFHESIACINYLQILMRWNLPAGRKIRPTSQVLGAFGTSGRDELDGEAPWTEDMELILFVPCTQTREQSHAVASLYYITFEIWWVSLGCCKKSVSIWFYSIFIWGLHQNCRRSTLLREDDDRLAYGCNQECSICFSSVIYVYKKLILHRWSILVCSMALCSYNHLH